PRNSTTGTAIASSTSERPTTCDGSTTARPAASPSTSSVLQHQPDGILRPSNEDQQQPPVRIVYASDIMAAMLRARRSPRTRTALDVLREWFRPPDPDAVAKLLDAMDAGQLVTRPVTVSCFLRGTAVAIPSHWRQGTLTLDGGAITWRRHLAVRPDLTRLPTKLDIEQVRKVA